MKNEEVLSALDNLLKESKVARSTIEFSSGLDRIKRRLTELEEEHQKMKELTRLLYEKLQQL